MAKRYWKYRKYSQYKRYRRSDPGPALLALLTLGVAYGIYANRSQIISYAAIAVAILGGGFLIYFLFKRKKEDEGLSFLSDDGILHALKSVTPAQFETEVAEIFSRLGYQTTVVGGANDGGIDIIATKSKKTYFIQCKKFITQVVTPHDVRDFLGAITNPKNPAEKGFLVTTGGFTLMANRTAEGNPRIELISGTQLVKYYRLAHKDAESEEELTLLEGAESQKRCPRCGGDLILKTAWQGTYAGQQFLGCSNYPQCKYIQNI